MKNYFIGLITLFVISSSNAWAQDPELIGMPEFAYSWNQSDDLQMSANFHSYHSLSTLDENSSFSYFESALVVTYLGMSNIKIGGGYKYRVVTPFVDGYQYEHRFLEQISFSSTLFDLNFSNRFRLEQRFKTGTYANRARYRLSYKIPIGNSTSGRSVKLYDEYLSEFNKDGSKAENRGYVGYVLPAGKGSLELGIQHRLQNLMNDKENKHLFVLYTKFALSK